MGCFFSGALYLRSISPLSATAYFCLPIAAGNLKMASCRDLAALAWSCCFFLAFLSSLLFALSTSSARRRLSSALCSASFLSASILSSSACKPNQRQTNAHTDASVTKPRTHDHGGRGERGLRCLFVGSGLRFLLVPDVGVPLFDRAHPFGSRSGVIATREEVRVVVNPRETDLIFRNPVRVRAMSRVGRCLPVPGG